MTLRTFAIIGLAVATLLCFSTRAYGTDKPTERTFLSGTLSAEDVAHLKITVPNLRIITGVSRDEALRLAPTLDGADTRYCNSAFLKAAVNLQWMQSTSAGVDRYVAVKELRDNDAITLTNMRAVHGPTIADHAFAMLLSLTRDMRYYLADDTRGTWNRSGSGREVMSLHDRTLLVVGLGGIGSEVARRGKGFGMHVWATRRSDKPKPDFVDRQERSGELLNLLPHADIIAICAPLTDETRGLFDAKAFAACKENAIIINVGRGKIIDTEALVSSLQSGHLAGACLDVTDPEPLPPDHALWQMDNVVITPHTSGRSSLTRERWTALYLENLRRFGMGEVLLNVVDKKAGY